ncbi:hypothetical protein GEMRC1_004322 [Eukaryota sp. GEM-RC1]
MSHTFHLSDSIKTSHRESKCLCVTPSSLFVGGDFSDPTIYEYAFDLDSDHYEIQSTLIGHTGFVTRLIFLEPSASWPSGRLISSSGDNSIIVWDLSTSNPCGVLHGHTNVVSSISISSGSLFSGSWDGTIRKWDIETLLCTAVLKGHSSPIQDVLAISPDEVLSCSSDKTVKLWCHSTVIETISGHPEIVRRIQPTSEPDVFVTVSHDGGVRFWNLRTQVCLESLFIHNHFVYAVSVGSFDIGVVKEVVVSGGEDQMVKITVDKKLVQEIKYPQVVWDISFMPNGDFAVASADGCVRIFTLDSTRKATQTVQLEFDRLVEESHIQRALHSS